MQFARYAGALLVTMALLAAGTNALAADASCPGGFSNQFRLNGQVQNPDRFRLVDLQFRPSVNLTVSYFSGNQGLVTKTYVGVPLIDLLNDAVVVTDPARKNDILRKYVQVKATDCYEVIVSVAELLSTFGHQQVLVAFETGDGQPLDATEGMARLIVPGDKAGGRFVSNVTTITVRTAP
jgi:Oxidoreductase molybdopterin binding domain